MNVVYKIINTVNSKVYIGVHQTQDINDSYMGSGVVIRKAIKKYGEQNFKKLILFTYGSGDDELDRINAFSKERELVSEAFVNSKRTYNLTIGGRGCSNHSKETIEKISKGVSIARFGTVHSDETKQKISVAHIGKTLSAETRLKISLSQKGEVRGPRGPLSHATKQKISEINTGRKLTTLQKLKLSNSLTNRKLSDEHRSNISKASKVRKYPLGPPCEYCGNVVRLSAYKRWHGDNCRMKEIV